MRARVTAAVALGLLATTAAAEPKTHVCPVPEGAHPHAVAPAPDGTVWYTAQNQGALGILDPRTGAVRQVPLGEGSAPHGVIAGPDGAAVRLGIPPSTLRSRMKQFGMKRPPTKK